VKNGPPAGRLGPVLLLLAAGACIGLIFPLGKLAAAVGIPPLLYAGASAAGASLVLAVICLALGTRAQLDSAVLRYSLVAGQLTFAIPFGTLVLVIPRLGSGIPAILQSLAPILTLVIVYALRLEQPNALRAAGLATGLAGAAVILATRSGGDFQHAAPLGWYFAAFITPVALAAGNVYRTSSWPKGASPLPLAALSLGAAAAGLVALLGIAWLAGSPVDLAASLLRGWWLILLQSLATGIGYAFFFRLQQVGGPVYLSQISYVNTCVGLFFAVAFFGERLTAWAWVAVLLIFAGVGLVNRAQPATQVRRRTR
jgi:drug/metabolite transporter (DMT)-like permease